PEHAEGRSQFDYLRRLGDEIERLDQKKQFAKNGVKAIGIVGSDVYDKLLILQALRGRFKDKIFFTTDLDARYLHADQKDWARNLVVASNFGLSLRPTLQHSTLPFRDSYQTATYLATLMALTDQSGWPLAIEDWLPAALEQPLTPYKPRRSPAQLGAFQPSSAGWTNKMENWLRPKIFEIGRTEAVHLASPSVHNLTGWIEGANPDGITSPAANTTCDGDWKTCTSIEPDWPSRGFWPEHFQNILIMFCLGILLLCLLFFLANRRVNEVIRAAFAEPSPEWNPARVTIGAVIGAVAVVSAIIANVGSLLDDSLTKGIGEPFVWLEGVSVWPSLVLRFISLIAMLAIWCLFLMLMDKQKRSISQDFKIPLPHTRTLSRSRWAAALSGPHLDLALFDKDGKAAMSSGVQDANVGEKVFDVTVLWQNYLRATSWKEMTGWIAASLFIGAILVALAFQILGKPSFPHRGELVATLHQILVLLNALVLWLVIFWVGYEIRACARFIETLSGVSNKWPEQLLRQKEEETGVPCTYLDDYLDFQLIVRATKRIHWIIYLPFVSILFTVFARSNFFDAMDFPLALVFIIGSALGYSLYSARLLRKSADAARATALGNYERQLFETTRPHGNTPPVLIVRPKTKPAQQPISVEQIAILADRIRSTRDGVFAPFVQQPALQALLLPFGGYGSVQILEYLFKL
ncbi:MAG: hypothetical protein OEU87_06955, partial [Nitrospira sp.]|nr:hypothetical protein [Nitrospira sp.]